MKVKDPEKITRWRNRRQLSQRDLAFLCRCSQNAISLVERGKLPTLSEELAMAIAKRLDVPWEDLFEARETSGVRRMPRAASTTHHKDAA
ncbi:MAG: helix-turn-helix transcriptional regulator [Nonomuraea sp.]|nr:helix-turn-helix transcriptional regulator [Nonomuraea sp.]NUQ33264.1 helix-turn-helix transcriptional regulator [Dermatophilaceae bacterium]NUR81082.1 helix-turn-helix transcriptional regulator [Dermatophilaceae bacterium]